jgi:hypothetical protein
MQSNVQTLPLAGNKLIPNDTPSRRLMTGPKMGDSNKMVDIGETFGYFLDDYITKDCFFVISPLAKRKNEKDGIQ